MKVILDKYQQEAVYSQEKNLLVVAAPGSGKTTVIINRIAYLVNDKRVNPDNIIVITFTKSAAASMKKRYQNITTQSRMPFFGTFHALFYKILRRHFGEIKILDSSDAYRIIRTVLLNYLDEISDEKIKEVLNGISLFKCSGKPLDEFTFDIDKNIFTECLNAYENYKKEKGLLDFDDLQIKSKRLLSERKDILDGYRGLFKYILVDEFQDCDSLQIELLQMLNYNNSLFAVGDEDQCIYGFRGSRPESMVDFNELFHCGKKVYLDNNYRSPQNIVDTSTVLISNNKMRNVKNIKAVRDERGIINVSYNMNESMQAEEIANNIEKTKLSDGFNYKSNAVLYRTNVESRSIIDVFIRKRIPFKLLDKEYNFFDHFICKDMLAYLSLSLDPTDRSSFSRIINKPFRYISKLNLEKMMTHKYKEDCFETLCSIDGIPVFQVKVLRDLKRDIHYLNKLSLRSAIDSIVMDLAYIDYIREYSSKFKIDINELEEILEEFKSASSEFLSIPALLAHVEEVNREIKKTDRDEESDYVILSTIHGVKGMEFDNIHIINCVEESMPHRNSLPKNLEEERRLFYVGITRAMSNLFLFVPKTIRGKAKETSRFISECKLNTDNKLRAVFLEGEKVVHDVFGSGEVVSLTGNDIDIRFQNGVLRKFDIIIVINNKLLKKIV